MGLRETRKSNKNVGFLHVVRARVGISVIRVHENRSLQEYGARTGIKIDILSVARF